MVVILVIGGMRFVGGGVLDERYNMAGMDWEVAFYGVGQLMNTFVLYIKPSHNCCPTDLMW